MRFNEKTFAQDYDGRLSSEGYPGLLLDAVIAEFDAGSSIADVGAGSGLFALPLSEAGFHVTAIEPSREMIRIMESKMSPRTDGSLKIIHSSWEDYRCGRFDGLICMHSIYPMVDPSSAVQKMAGCSFKSIVAVRSDDSGPSLSDAVRKKLCAARPEVKFNAVITNILEKKGIPFTSKRFRTERFTRFKDPSSEADYFSRHIGLDQNRKGEIIGILLEKAELINGEYFIKSTYDDVFIIF
ncbi:MAG: class I SAM-dependent methyltransferase [Spirochaetes bacterium]|jgi:SAM-dependent methyltransferase|nr:class I SAM-dependent methyltransferase [Spirochaetota bacterium]